MIPVLYAATETEFTSNGIGALSSVISCKIRQEVNGEYELEMQYPVSGLHYNDIALRSAIKAKPDKVTDPQIFRVYRITKPLAGIVSVYARHIAYDLAGIPVQPFVANGAADAMTKMKNHAVVECPFEFSTTIGGGKEFSIDVPTSIWNALGDEGLLATYGGEYTFDNYRVTLNDRRGADTGVAIRYGKNLTDLEQEANCSNCYTGVYPYWQSKEELVTLTEKTVSASGSYGYTKILPVDFSGDFEEKPTETQLREAATAYMEENNIGTPEVSWKVEFVALEDTDEYKGSGVLERISLGDTVLVEFDKLGVNASARAVSTVYDSVLERYDSITLGKVKNNIAKTISDQKKEIEKKPSKSMVEKISDSLASAIMGANGGSVRLLDTNGDGEPDTLYIADNPNPATAVKVWRFNYEGWAASSTGYNGSFVMGATFEDGIMANLINVANLFAENITMTGTFTNTTEAFLEPNQDVVDRILRHLLDTETVPESELWKYDFNNDGQISGSDLVLANMARLGRTSFAEWSGAVKTPVTCTINLSNPAKALVMSGTDMWGNYRESVIGVDPATATFVQKSALKAIVDMNPDGEMYREIDGEKEYFNPCTAYEDSPNEFRTTERWENKPVYLHFVKYEHSGTLGSSSGTTNVDVPHNIPWTTGYKLVRIEANANNADLLPFLASNGGMTIVNGISDTYIKLRIRNDYWTNPTFYFRVYYTKN